jgi:hypothetical protein
LVQSRECFKVNPPRLYPLEPTQCFYQNMAPF